MPDTPPPASLGALSVQAAFTGTLAACVGFASTFAVILAGLRAVGATPPQAACGLFALSIAMGVCGVWVSLRTRLPISVAWTTPGAALLINSAVPQGGFAGAVGAFLAAGGLLVLAGLIRPLARLVAAIPPPLASAMLAGILLNLCLAPVRAVATMPALALPIVLVWLAVARWRRLYAIPAAVLVTIVLVAATAPAGGFASGLLLPAPRFVVPEFSVGAMIGLALPLFVVTMASQNIPGLAVLRANGYRPEPGALFTATGLATLASAGFGAPGINLAAITASLCAGPDAHADPSRRYWAATVSGAVYIVMGLLAGAATGLAGASPPILIEAVAGLALLGAFGQALHGAVADLSAREAALVTFLVTCSGISVFGVGAAFWGLLAGLGMLGLRRWGAGT